MCIRDSADASNLSKLERVMGDHLTRFAFRENLTPQIHTDKANLLRADADGDWSREALLLTLRTDKDNPRKKPQVTWLSKRSKWLDGRQSIPRPKDLSTGIEQQQNQRTCRTFGYAPSERYCSADPCAKGRKCGFPSMY